MPTKTAPPTGVDDAQYWIWIALAIVLAAIIFALIWLESYRTDKAVEQMLSGGGQTVTPRTHSPPVAGKPLAESPPQNSTAAPPDPAALLGIAKVEPALSRLAPEEAASAEAACSNARKQGTAAYTQCIDVHVATLEGATSFPDLLGLSGQEKKSAEAACSGAFTQGPFAYDRCITRQLAALRGKRKVE